MRAAPYAVLDVGTTSVKCLIAERGPDRRWRTLVDRAEVTRLGEGLEESGAISQDALARTVEAIEGMASVASSLGAQGVVAVGTAGLRRAMNAREAIEAIRQGTGITVEVISGEEEGALAYLAAASGLRLPDGSLVVFDTGGGSSQFTFGQEGRVDERISLPVGALRYTEAFRLDGVVPDSRLAEARVAIVRDLAELDGRRQPDALVGMGGAVTNLAAVARGMAAYDAQAMQGSLLERAEVERQVERYQRLDAVERQSVVGLQPKRARVILAGACIVAAIMDRLGQGTLTVSDRGLRHGLLEERFSP